SHETATREDSEIVFYGNDLLSEHVRQQDRIRPRVLGGEQSNTSIIYDNKFFLKLFRKVDQAINPDLELTRFLSEKARFANIPAFVGAIEWRFGKEPIVLGLLQELVEASGDAWNYMLERLDTYNENILAQPEIIKPSTIRGTIIDPVEYEKIPESMKHLLEAPVAEQAFLLGVRTGEMHKLLASGTTPEFAPEPYSLHYQRSLYAGLQSLVRSTFQSQSRNMHKLSA